MSERKFIKNVGKLGTAAQLRETVSQVVKESSVQSKPQLVEPLDFENFVQRNKTYLQNDPQRELLIYPVDDFSQIVLPKRSRTTTQFAPGKQELDGCGLLTKQCIRTYSSNWNVVHYKYSAYSGAYADLPKLETVELKEEVFEVDADMDTVDEQKSYDGLRKEGYLMKGPESGSDRMFPNIGSKSFKRRYCCLRQEVDGTYILDLYKDDKKGDAKTTIVMDFCIEIVKSPKRGRLSFELRMTAGHKSYLLVADDESEYKDWLNKLGSVLQQNKLQEEKRAASLERDKNATPPASPQVRSFGTLKGLEHSMNPQLNKYARETDISVAHSRKQNRRKLFSLYPEIAVNLKPSPQSAEQVEPYKEVFGQRIFIKCESISFKLQLATDDKDPTTSQVEPYHTTLCLFDAKSGRKLTENFHFDLNTPSSRSLLPGGIQNGLISAKNEPIEPPHHIKTDLPGSVASEWTMYPRRAILNVMNPHSDVFLVVRIEKILQGGICQSVEPYLRAAKDCKLGAKVHKGVLASSYRLGSYRMPFGWAAKPLFKLYSNELDTNPDFPIIYRQETNKLADDELLKFLSEMRKPDKLNKLTVIPGSLKINIHALTESPENTLTTSFSPLRPFPLPPTKDVTLEVIEFESVSERDVHPYVSFLNHLYVYPQCLNFDTQKIFTRARNIACVMELRDSDADDAKGLQCIYGRAGQAPLVTQASCAVLHHSTIPMWYEEIKVRLPINLQPSHHLLFTFYHISCDITKKQNGGVESCVGYAWIPLLHKGKLNIDTQSVPVASHLPPGYLAIHPFGLGKGNAGPEITWIDNQRSIFTLTCTLVSTVNTRDQHLFNLFAHSERLLDPKHAAQPNEGETCKVIKALHAVQLSTLITFLPTLLNQLLILLLAINNQNDIGLNIVRVMINLVNMVYEANRKEVLDAYVKYVFTIPDVGRHTTVHEEMAKHFPAILHPNNTDFLVVNKFMHHSNVFFDIMVKAMAQYLLTTGRIKMHRNERFTTEYLQNIETMLTVLIPYIFNKHQEMPNETLELNKNIALFLKKCLSLMDRGFVFKLINMYMDKFNPGDSRPLHEYKFDFLQIICSHEHYVILNLPMQTRISPKNHSPDYSQDYCLSQEFCKHHFIVALLLLEVKSSLNEIPHVRKIALRTLRELVAKHEMDDRYKNKGQMNRIALIYIPWLNIVLENLNRLNVVEKGDDPCASSIITRISQSSSNLLAKNSSAGESYHRSNRFTLHMDKSPINIRNSAFFDAIAGQSAVTQNHSLSLESDLSFDRNSVTSQETAIVRQSIDEGLENGHAKNHHRNLSVNSPHIQRYDKLELSELKDVLICYLFVIKYLGEEQLIIWWQQYADGDVTNFFSALEMCLHCFKYVGKKDISVTKSGIADCLKPKPTKAHTLPARMNPPNFNHENTGTLVTYTINRENLVDFENEEARKQQALLEQNMATEVGLIVLDCLGLYCTHFKKTMLADDGDNPVLKKVFDIYLSFMQIGQSETLYSHIFPAIRSFINNFSAVLFKGNASLCGRLCYELLRCCSSRLPFVRQESCAILYLLMRSNFVFTDHGGLTRVHLQLIISVSQMLGTKVGLSSAKFQESLSLINSYATSDKAMKGTGFPIEVKDLTRRIRTVLMATAQMREHNHDPEMLVDLQHSLANSYASTPELRLTWLETMTRNHVRDGNFSEAACCQLHIAALMAEYLKLKKAQGWGAEAFSKLSSNIARDERGLKLDVGVQDVHYTELILLEQLETCVEYIEKSERYEMLGDLYKLITPVYEAKHDYERLRLCYQNLAQSYGKVIEVYRTGKRLLGRFYRVAFYGQAYFEDDHAIEYVYKEPKVTSLSEVSERLLKQYTDKFGRDSVKMIQDSAPTKLADLDPKFAYIQVTHVNPYFEKPDLESRQTEFHQNHDISCFMFETPFTKDGKSRGNPEEQWKRKTIITTQYSFPYVKKRIQVVARRMLELSPIEVAIDEMQSRVAELEDVVFTSPSDIKKLQLVLQGSVCVQVNAGPMAYASVFLDPSLSNLYAEEKVEELKDIYREFVKICYSALQINSKLISGDQQQYQEVLRDNYKRLCTSLSALFSEPLWPHEDAGSFDRNSTGLFSTISGASHSSSIA